MKKANYGYSIEELCRVFSLSVSSYYYKPKNKLQANAQLVIKVKEISMLSEETYGKRRICNALNNEGYDIGVYKTKTLMNLAKVKVKIPKKKHMYLDSGTQHKYAENLLNREFSPAGMNDSWVGDITYIDTSNGWLYLATVMDLYNREIIGFSMSKSPNAELAKQALNNAIERQRPDTTKLLFHSDQGCQYTAKEFRDNLKIHQITQSMSRRGNCWDNAVQERFFRSLKSESLNYKTRNNHDEAISQINHYIMFYNYRRSHSAIGYVTPHQKGLASNNISLKNVA